MSKKDRAIVPWGSPSGIKIDREITEVPALVGFAQALKPRETERIVKAFQDGYFDMGTEFIWRKSMARLKSTISTLGMKFVGEMLDRKDIDEFSSAENVLTDFDTIRLAESLGIINSTGAFRLRQGFELIYHFFGERAEIEEEELSLPEAVTVVRTCIQYVLGEQDIGVAVDFSRFRNRLVTGAIERDDSQLQELLNSPPFFVSTVLRVFIAGLKVETAVRLENLLINFGMIVPLIWASISEEDKWSLGSVYAEMVAVGNSTIVASLKKALISISGFDYVPENLRSNTYKAAAQAVIKNHFSFNNFYLEEGPVKQLASLGSRIPKAALSECMQAYLCVFLGNRWGFSFSAAPIALRQLQDVSKDRWSYFLSKVIDQDDVLIYKLLETNPVERFITLVRTLDLSSLAIDNNTIGRMINAASEGRSQEIKNIAMRLYDRIRPEDSGKAGHERFDSPTRAKMSQYGFARQHFFFPSFNWQFSSSLASGSSRVGGIVTPHFLKPPCRRAGTNKDENCSLSRYFSVEWTGDVLQYFN